MVRYSNVFGYWDLTLISFVFNSITMKITKTDTTLKFSVFMGLEENNKNRTKHLK